MSAQKGKSVVDGYSTGGTLPARGKHLQQHPVASDLARAS